MSSILILSTIHLFQDFPRSPRKSNKFWRFNALGLFSCPRASHAIPTHRCSHCRNLCRNRKICSIYAAEFLHGSQPHLVTHHDQGDQARRCPPSCDRWRPSVPLAVRQRRLSWLALRLQPERSAQHTEPGYLSQHWPEPRAQEDRRSSQAGQRRHRPHQRPQGGPWGGGAPASDRAAGGSRPAAARLLRGSRPRMAGLTLMSRTRMD